MRNRNDELLAKIDRRRLLMGLGLVVSATDTVSAASAGADVAPTDKNLPQHAGYRETEAVRTYYRSARF